MREIEILKYPSLLLKLILQHPNTGKNKFFAVIVWYTVSFGLLFTITLIQFPLTFDNPTQFVENFQAFGFFTQTFGKLIICISKRKELMKLLQDTEKFWLTDVCNENVRKSLDNIFEQTLRLQKLFFSSLMVTLVICEVHPYFTKEFPLGIWLLQEHEWLYGVVLGVQEILVPYLTLHAAAFDGMFLGFCISIFVQFKILKTKMKSLTVSNISDGTINKCYTTQLTSYIKHHIFLLRFADDMRNMYSPTMFVEYLSLVLIFCAEMFILSDSRDTTTLAKHFFTMMSVFIQLAFYCFPGDYIASEASEVCQAIFESDWYSNHLPSLKTTIPLIIQRTQKEIVFTAGGLYNMNSRTLISVLKLAYSVCVAIRAVR